MRACSIGFIFIVLFFFRQIFGGEVWYCCDNLLINIPARTFQKEILFPTDNPYVFSGTRFLADINLATFYPGNIFFWVFNDPFRALSVSIIFHFFLSFVGTYLAAYSLGLPFIARIGSGIVFTFSGTLVTYTNNLPMLQVAALLPWVFWAWVRLGQNQSVVRIAIYVCISTIQIFGGHAQLTFLTWLLLVSWIIVFRPSRFRPILVAIVCVFILSSVQIIPFVIFASQSTRGSFGYTYAVFDSLNPFSIVRLVIPWVVGILNKGTAWVMGGSVYGYVGVLPFIFVLALPRNEKKVKFLLTITIAAFLLALGKHTPIYPTLYRFLPGFGLFRSPQHYLLLVTFCLAMLSGFGFAQIRKLRPILVAAMALGILAAICIFTPLADILRSDMKSLVLLNIGISLIFLTLVYKFPSQLLACCILFVDLVIFTKSNMMTHPLSEVRSWFQKSESLARLLPARGAIYVHKDLYKAPFEKEFGKNTWPQEVQWQIAILRPNIHMLYKLVSIDGYASMVPRAYQDSFGLQATDPTGINMGEVRPDVLVSHGVDTVIAPADPAYIAKLYPYMLWAWRGDIAIYRLQRK